MRPIWKGAISFGLVIIPIKLYSATLERRLSFNLLRKKDLCPIKYVRVCGASGEEVPLRQIVKGYQIEKGNYVVLEEDDFKRADAKKTQLIEVMEFVDLNEVQQKYIEKPYYLEPAEGAGKAYAILREALAKANKVGIAKFVLKDREHLSIIKPEKEMILLEQIRFADEIRDYSELKVPRSEKYSEKEIDIAIQLIDQMTVPFNPEKYKDTYTDSLLDVIRSKYEGKQVKFVPQEMPAFTEVPDIMAKLKESLEHAKTRKEK